MVKYLVTGGCGFIGSHLVSELLQKGHSAVVIDNLSTGKKENLPSGVELIVQDLHAPFPHSILEGIEGCFHLAALPSATESILSWKAAHTSNALATVSLIDAILASKRPIPIVFTSSAAVYGDARHFPLNETSPTLPLSPYGLDKLFSEKHLSLAWALHGLPSLSFRLFNVYGPKQESSSPYAGVISIFAKRLSSGEKITLFGDGEQRRDFVFVEDVVAVLIAAMTNRRTGASLFNLCTGEGTSLLQLLALLEKLQGKEAALNKLAARPGDILCSIGSTAHLEAALHIKPQTTLYEGLKKTCATF